MIGNKLKVGLCQMMVGADKKINIQKAVSSITDAVKAQGAQVVVLPECFNCPYGTSFFPKYAEPIHQGSKFDESGETVLAMSDAARSNKCWLVAGSIPEIEAAGAGSDDDKAKHYNTSMCFNPKGELVNIHRKVHLFKINTDTVKFDESEVLTAGNTMNAVSLGKLEGDATSVSLPSDELKIGVGICFDIRYPQLAANYQKQGTSVLFYPGAFNMVTGPVHWELSAKARAIDNQQYVVLCSPARDESAGYVAFGSSLVVDPWGDVVAKVDEKEHVFTAELDLGKIGEIRKKLPILSGNRTDLRF